MQEVLHKHRKTLQDIENTFKSYNSSNKNLIDVVQEVREMIELTRSIYFTKGVGVTSFLKSNGICVGDELVTEFYVEGKRKEKHLRVLYIGKNWVGFEYGIFEDGDLVSDEAFLQYPDDRLMNIAWKLLIK